MITQDELPMLTIPSMNDNHFEEIQLINKLEKVSIDRDIQAVSQTLTKLLEHTTEHFLYEEQLMKEVMFPAFNEHKTEHDRHLSELESIISYFEKNQEPKAILAYIEGNLARWVLYHIQTMDNDVAMFLNNQTKQ